MNIFNVINSVTSRIEPFHSEFLAVSISKDIELRNKFLELILPDKLLKKTLFSSNLGSLEIKSEVVFCDKKRIDVVVNDKDNKIAIGIEVKTNDLSVTENQLFDYLEGMKKKYAGYLIYIVYLTPYNKHNIPDVIIPIKVNSIREFDIFNKKYRESIHINWENIIDLYKIEGSFNCIYANHRDYIKEKIINDSNLITRLECIERNRMFTEFIGSATFDNFISFLKKEEVAISENDKKFTINLSENVDKFTRIIESLEILFSSDKLNKTVTRENEVKHSLIDSYKNSRHKDFFIMLFSAIHDYPYLWLKGKKKIGLRASHPSHKSSGVSLLTINFDSIDIIKQR